MTASTTTDTTSAPLTSGGLASKLGAELTGPGDLPITGVETIERAGATHLVFIRSAKYAEGWETAKARVALVGPDFKAACPADKALIRVKNVDVSLSTALELLAPPTAARPYGAHPTAVVDPAAQVAATASIGPRCVIEAGAKIEDHAVLVANVFVGAGAVVGAGTVVHPNVTLYTRVRVGRQCIIHGGAVLGADGFGFLPDPSGRGLVKVPHIGDVVVGDAVEIGANACIDRAKFGSTTVGSGTKIDNLVQIGHNCTIGRGVVLCGQVGIGGSTTIGDGVMLGGQVGVSDHLTVGTLTKVGAGSGVLESLPAKQSFLGYPARPSFETLRHWSWMRQFRQTTRTEVASGQAAASAAADAAVPGTIRWTVAGPARFRGIGLFTAAPATVTIHPATSGGIRLRTEAGDLTIDVRAVATEASKLPFPTGVQARNTTLAWNGAAVATVEHLLSALTGLGITDAVISVEGPEIPMFDGSAAPIVDAIVSAGLKKLDGRVDPILLSAPVTVSRGDTSIVATPRSTPGFSYTYVIEYGPAIPRASVSWTGESAKYQSDIAPCRTFCLVSEAKAMRDRGMFTHVSTKEMLVLDDRTGEPIDNALRFSDEPARHKLLDLIGDLALLGRPIQADIVATRSGHALAHEFCRAVMASKTPQGPA